jgi:hypothetical protein
LQSPYSKNGNRYLVILRAGDTSLHPQWLAGNERNWDLVISYFGDNPQRYAGQYDFLHRCKGSKWQGIADFFAANSQFVSSYNYVWLPDDDLFTTGKNISEFFQLVDSLSLTLAQPALTAYSFHSWKITLQDKGVLARLTKSVGRLTNFVEIMAPCFRVDHLPIFSKTFGENTSGWGYEWLWWKLAEKNGVPKFGIIDQTPVYHSRPVGAAGHGGSESGPDHEFKLLMRKFDLLKTKPKVLGRLFSR